MILYQYEKFRKILNNLRTTDRKFFVVFNEHYFSIYLIFMINSRNIYTVYSIYNIHIFYKIKELF